MISRLLRRWEYAAVLDSGDIAVAGVNDNRKLENIEHSVKLIDDKYKKIKCDFVLDHDDYDIATLEVPAVPKVELVRALEWEAKKIFGDGDDKLIFDFYYQPSSKSYSKEMINAVAVEKSLVDDVKNKALKENIFLKKITVPEMIYKDSCQYLNSESGVCFIIVNGNLGKVVVVEKKEVCFSRKFNLSYDKGVAYESLLLLEVQRSLDYCERQYNMKIPSFLCVLGDVVTDSVIEVIKSNVSTNVSVGLSSSHFPGESHLSSDQRLLLCVSCLSRM